ncbi:probable G-protein coupled receptor 101 [Microtus oregoni]|uniref:probable G-protein coupled receptor 101 n=1 Tax=Microtus oregoni TaxID=111838 RepID=UPI001BB2B509|nr:probable G-protein coupled receptor 101 [Microtus oregoni]
MTPTCTNSTGEDNSSQACMPLSKMPISLAHGIIRATVLFAFLAVSFVGNVVLGYVLNHKPQLMQVSNRFVFNLLITDLLQITIVAPWVIATSIPAFWPLNSQFCTALVSLTHLFAFATVNTIMVVSVDRYLCIIHPLSYPSMMTTRRAHKLLQGTWFLAILQSTPPLYNWGQATFDERNALCSMIWGGSPVYTMISVASFIVVPLAVMIGCYSAVFGVARRQHALLYNNAKSRSLGVRAKDSVKTENRRGIKKRDEFQDENEFQSKDGGRRNSNCNPPLPPCYQCKAARVIFLIIFSYMISLGPYCFIAVLAVWVDVQTKVPQWAITIIIWLFFLQCCIHPYVYGYMNQSIKKEINEVLRKLLRKNRPFTEVSHRDLHETEAGIEGGIEDKIVPSYESA